VKARTVQSADEIRQGLIQQLTSPLRWEQSIRKMIKQGVETFIEVGPGRVLSSMILRIQRKVKVFNLEEAENLDPIQKTSKSREA
jgi:[acyl-carrier-protein] S-malonyltransferase